LLLDERSLDAIVAKLMPCELEQIIKLVGCSPSCYPPGTLDTLKGRRPAPPAPAASISISGVASGRPAERIKPDAKDMRRAKEGRLARLRAHARPVMVCSVKFFPVAG
jgi:hypothetical protein